MRALYFASWLYCWLNELTARALCLLAVGIAWAAVPSLAVGANRLALRIIGAAITVAKWGQGLRNELGTEEDDDG